MDTRPAVVARCGDAQLTLHEVTDIVLRPALRSIIRDLTSDDAKVNRFPGPNPVSLDTSHFSQLKKEPYYACEKTDGVRFLMIMCEYDGLDIVAIMDRSWALFLVPLQHVPVAMYQGTALDGELAYNRQTRAWEFLVFDAVCVSGVPVLNDPLDARLAAARKALTPYNESPDDPLGLRVKTFVECRAFGGVDDLLKSVHDKYDIDGIVLTPANAPVVYGRHVTMFKLKFDSRHTVDFLVDSNRNLCVFDSGRHVPVGTLRGDQDVRHGSIAECAFVSDGVWDLVMIRTDKTTANDMFTYRKTLLNMRENLTLDDVRAVFTL